MRYYISHFYLSFFISYSNTNEISYFKDVANGIQKNTPFDLQPEDGFIKKPKHFFIIKPTKCTNFTNLFCHETLHVPDSSSVHHQEFIHRTHSNGVCHTGL
jgi:hypothetical protein